METILEIKDLTVSFGGKRVLTDVGFSIYPGEIMALVGESGSGKTITALSVLNLLPPSALRESGTVLFKGNDILKADLEKIRSIRGRDIAMVFQEPFTALNPVIRISAQLKEAIVTHKACPKGNIDGNVHRAQSGAVPRQARGVGDRQAVSGAGEARGERSSPQGRLAPVHPRGGHPATAES